MLHTITNELILVVDSQSGVRPAAAYGTSVTPGNNAYSSYVDLLSATSEEAHWVEININSIAASATATDTLVTIGIDRAGGTTYTDFIPHLLAGAASPYQGNTVVGGFWYRFPLFVPSGASLGVKASQNNASPGTANVLVRLYRQSRLDAGPRIGSYVKTFGEVTASSKGTDITPGTTAEGDWAQLGSAVSADDHLFFWQVGVGQSSTTFSNAAMHIDMGIGDGTSYRTPILDELYNCNTTEFATASYEGAYAEAASGDKIYGRIQTGAGSNTMSMIAYAVGG